MKTKFALTSLVAVLGGFSALATSASAHSEIRVGLGFYAPAPVYCAPAPVYYAPATAYYAPAPVAYAPAPVYCAPAAPVVVESPAGYWNTVAVKFWVPERWEIGRDRFGHAVREFHPGYYSYRNDRVWVAHRR